MSIPILTSEGVVGRRFLIDDYFRAGETLHYGDVVGIKQSPAHSNNPRLFKLGPSFGNAFRVIGVIHTPAGKNVGDQAATGAGDGDLVTTFCPKGIVQCVVLEPIGAGDPVTASKYLVNGVAAVAAATTHTHPLIGGTIGAGGGHTHTSTGGHSHNSISSHSHGSAGAHEHDSVGGHTHGNAGGHEHGVSGIHNHSIGDTGITGNHAHTNPSPGSSSFNRSMPNVSHVHEENGDFTGEPVGVSSLVAANSHSHFLGATQQAGGHAHTVPTSSTVSAHSHGSVGGHSHPSSGGHQHSSDGDHSHGSAGAHQHSSDGDHTHDAITDHTHSIEGAAVGGTEVAIILGKALTVATAAGQVIDVLVDIAG